MKNWFLIAVGLACLAVPLYAKGLEVSPSSYHWRVDGSGKRMEMAVPIKIVNRSARKRIYTVRARTPAEINVKADHGFGGRIGTDWVAFETAEVEVLPETAKTVKVFMAIPPPNYRKGEQGMFYVEVKERPPRNDRFALAAYLKMYVVMNK